MNKDSCVTDLARQAVEKYILSGLEVQIKEEQLPEILKKEAGVFVSLKKNGRLRGCMGTFKPVQKNAAYEIISNAVTAAENDPRFPAVQKEELSELEISVDILSAPDKINDKSELNAKKFGILVKKGHQTGLLLPDLEGIETIEKQIRVAKKKAGLREKDKVEIYRFQVSRFKENG